MITVSQLKDLNNKNNGGFFGRGIMRKEGETIRSFNLIQESPGVLRLTRKKADNRGNVKSWLFSEKTGLRID